MSSIFNYQTLNVRLDKATRTLFIKLSSDNLDNAITMETLFELESLLAWVSTKVEIHSIFIESTTDIFSIGYNQKVLKKLTIDRLAKFTDKLQKINQALMLLPQTVILDLQMGAQNIACELAAACDIRIANRAASISFNHSKLGLVPCSGGIAQLSELVGHGNAKNWLLSGAQIDFNKMQAAGFIFESYTMTNRDEVIQNLLNQVHSQAPVQRIQTKLGIIENVREQIESKLVLEKQIAKAAHITEDWKEENAHEPMKAKNMKQAVKLSLIKNDPDLPN